MLKHGLSIYGGLAIWFASSVHAAAANVSDLTVQILGVDVARGGRIQIAVYRSADAFESYDPASTFVTFSRQLAGLDTAVQGRSTAVSFTVNDLPIGKYAVHYYHDINNNQRFDMDGDKPMDGWGASGARHMWQKPTFKSSAFTVDRNSQVIEMKTFYVD